MTGHRPRLGVICSVLLLGLSGCCTARFVSVDGTSAVVAIPDDSNTWPTYNRQHAEELMQQKFPQGYVIDHEEEVVTGTIEQTRTNTQTRGSPILAALKVAPIEEETNRSTAYIHQKEWRIWCHAQDAPAPPVVIPAPPGPRPTGEVQPAPEPVRN
jgi:hypothetical protein